MFFSTSRFFLYASVFLVAIVTTSTLFPFIVGKYSWFRVCVDLALIAFLLGLIWDPRADFMKKRLLAVFKAPLFWAISAFTVVFLLASLFGVDPSASFWSNFERGEGGLQILHLFVFFTLLSTLFSEERNWEKIFLLSLFAAMLVAGYGTAAALKYVGSDTVNGVVSSSSPFYAFRGFVGPAFGAEGTRISGSIGNPAYTAAYFIFAMFYGAYLLLGKFRRRLTSPGAIGIFAMVLISLIFFYLAATRGALLGLVAGVMIALSYMVYENKKWRKKGLIIEGVFLALFVIMILLQDNAFINKIPGSRIFDISFSAETWKHRTIMWETAWEGFKERPLLGWGPENFISVFDKHFNTDYYDPQAGFGAWFDRAHSLIFDYLAETGILGLLSYLSIFFAFYWQFFKSKREDVSKVLKALVFAVPAAYLVQALVLFDVLTIYFNLFLVLAFGYYFTTRQGEIKRT